MTPRLTEFIYFEVPLERWTEALDWCSVHLHPKREKYSRWWITWGNLFAFRDEKDAVMFALKFK